MVNTGPNKSKPAKHRYNVQEDLDDINRFFETEDLHGAIIRAHSYLHQILWQVLQTVDPDRGRLQKRPTFHQCLERTRENGLKEQFYKPLRYLNNVRNRFAHEHDAVLGAQDVEGLFSRFSDDDKQIVTKTFDTLKAQFGWTEDGIFDLCSKDALVFLFIHLWAVLRAALLHGQKVDIPPPVVALTTFLNPLLPVYDEAGELSRLSDDLTYLMDAYERTEEHWRNNFADMTRVKLVILGEAPLYGGGEVYIYNPGASHTNFLYPRNLEPITGQSGRGWGKPELLSALRQLGILVIDIYPYCFNEADTPFTYPGLSRAAREDLLRQTLDFYLRPKLEEIRAFGPDVRFCARYSRVGELARSVLPDMLRTLGFRDSKFVAISRQGGMVDPQTLATEYQAAVSG